jgi:hypothetical protein
VGFRSKPLVVLSMVLVLAGALGGWHAPDDNDDFAPAHHHADHNARFATPIAPTSPEHCVFCHWLRALGNGAPVATQLFAAERFQFTTVAELDGLVRTTARLALPARAPPLV